MSMLLAPQTIASMKAYGIAHAAQFDGATGYLSWLPTAAGDRKTWTLSMWVARAGLAGYEQLLSASVNAQLYFDATAQTLRWAHNSSIQLNTECVFRDPCTFFHLVLVWDSANATHKVYINGERVGAFTTEVYPALDLDGTVNAVITHNLGRYTAGLQYFSGIMADVHFIDGQALTPGAFGKRDVATGNWTARGYAGAYGDNGFYLDFSAAANLGADRSGNGNDWTVNGTITQVTSTPTNIYAVGNALGTDGQALSNGNLDYSSGAVQDATHATFLAPYDVPVYFEILNDVSTSSGVATSFGLADAGHMQSGDLHTMGSGNPWWGLISSNTASLYGSGSSTLLSSRLLAGEVGQVFRDGDDVWVGKGGFWYDGSGTFGGGDPSARTTPTFTISGSSGKKLVPFAAAYGNSGTLRFRESDWTLTPPAGAMALCSNNLHKVTGSIRNHWSNTLFTLTGDAMSVTGVGFQPGFVLAKDRDNATARPELYDAARGPTKLLRTSLSNAEDTISGLTSFDADGFSLGNGSDINSAAVASDSVIAWCANLPDTRASGWSVGTITPIKEIYNDSAMFKMSVVTYTGNGTAGATIPHSLGVKPGVMIVKRLDATGNWAVYHSSLGATMALWLDLTNAASTASTYWNATAPTETLVSLGSDARVNANGGAYVAYLFAPSDGIKIGDYVGNGNANGPLINEGISPVFELHKKTSAADDWIIQDNARSPNNPTGGKYLKPNSEAAEVASGDGYDWLANGWKIRTTTSNANSSGGAYVYLMIGQPTGGGDWPPATVR